MNKEQQMLVPRLRGRRDNFMFWLAQVRVILKAKCLWLALRGEDATSSMLQGRGMEMMEAGAGNVMDEELVRDAA